LEVGVGGTNDDEVNDEVVLSEKKEAEVGGSSGSEVGSSAGRLGVGSTVGGREELVVPSGVVVVMPGGGGGGSMEVGVSVGTLDGEGLDIEELEGGGSTIVAPPEVKVEPPVEGSGTTIVEPPEVEALGVTEGVVMMVELPEDGGSGTIIVEMPEVRVEPPDVCVEPPSVGGGSRVIVEPLEIGGGDDGVGVRVPVEIVLEAALVDVNGLEVKLICDVGGRLGATEEIELDKLGLDVIELTSVEPADVEPADDEPETDKLDCVRLELGAVGLIDDDEETVTDELVTVVLGIEKLVGVLVPGGLLGGKETEVTAEVLLEPDEETGLDVVVSVEDQALDVWLDMVGDRPKLELCSGGMTMIVVDASVDDDSVAEGSAVDVVED